MSDPLALYEACKNSIEDLLLFIKTTRGRLLAFSLRASQLCMTALEPVRCPRPRARGVSSGEPSAGVAHATNSRKHLCKIQQAARR